MEYNIIGKYNKDCKIFAKTNEGKFILTQIRFIKLNEE